MMQVPMPASPMQPMQQRRGGIGDSVGVLRDLACRVPEILQGHSHMCLSSNYKGVDDQTVAGECPSMMLRIRIKVNLAESFRLPRR